MPKPVPNTTVKKIATALRKAVQEKKTTRIKGKVADYQNFVLCWLARNYQPMYRTEFYNDHSVEYCLACEAISYDTEVYRLARPFRIY